MTESSSDRLLLAHSYYLRFDDKQYRRMKPYPPLNTMIVAAMARDRGFDVHLFDAMLASGPDAFETTLDAVRPRIVAIIEDNFNFLTKMCTTRMREAALAMVRAARSRGCRVVVNGSDATDHAALFLDAGADAVIVGEVEPTLMEVVEAWRADPDAALDSIAGLALKAGVGPVSGNGASGELPVLGMDGRGGPVRRTPDRDRLRDLDALPFPAWDLVDVDRYRRAWRDAHGRFSWNMVTSRGCPYGCNWCAKPVFGRLYTQRSPSNVAEEMRRLRDEVGPDHIWFADDIWGLTADWIEEFAREVARRDARTPFMIQSRVNLMQPRTVRALEAAGAEEVWMGVESGSQEILDAMDKGSRVEEARRATRTLKRQGMLACWFIQLGYLGEEWEEILMTRDLIREERPDRIGVSVSYPLPGTRFYDMVRERMGRKRNWVDSGDLDMMFHGTYESGFYRTIRDVLHAEVEAYGDAGARRRLDRRWAELEARESRVRMVELAERAPA
ncbi:MAG: B12-binding domain-containing radical SAM protein [Gemmatimonadota bacterium]